jgi:glycogen debranching enzyme
MQLSRGQFAHADSSLALEWLVTNGLGGFAGGTVAQVHTRGYHGLLFAALQPPVRRILTLSKLGVTVEYRDRRYELDSNEFADGTLSPRGFERLGDFTLEHGLPLWRFVFEYAVLKQRIWMPHGRNGTCDGASPHHPRGCFARAWSVGEVLRAWHALARARDNAQGSGSRAAGTRDALSHC